MTPRYWPGWLAAGLLWLLGRTPVAFGMALSRPLGRLLQRLMKSRRHVAERNIERCFPELGAQRRADLVYGSFQSLGRMLFETAWCWSSPVRRIMRRSRTEGEEYARRALDEGRGVLMITAHVTCLEVGGVLTGLTYPGAAGMYRPLGNPVLEWYQNRGRSRYAGRMISKRDMRGAIRFLRDGNLLWYAPDQDFGPRQSLFAPFFGIPAATLAVTRRLVELTGCAVVPMFPMYDAAAGEYVMRCYPPLEDFPGSDPVQDLARINALMEEQVRQAPEQYWWIHRRFKTRPPGEEPFYD